MTQRLTVHQFTNFLKDVPADGRLAIVQEYIQGIADPEQRALAESMFLVGLDIGVPTKKHLVVLIHGIRTHAVWQERLAHELTSVSDVEVFPIGYGFFDVINFLCPFLTRRRPISRVLREIRSLRAQYKNADISIVAHSFGTYIISEILSEETDVELHRLQLCGSIIPINYRWDKVSSRISGVLVNDVGTRDYWPVFAKIATWGFGPSGTFGFKTSKVRDRYYDCGHSDFFTDDHMRKYWVPLVVDGQVVASTWTISRPSPGIRVSFLAWFPLKTFIGLCGAGYLAILLLRHIA